MALPEPTINIDDLLVGNANPVFDVATREGSVIRSIARPYIESPYGPDNLPEFMRGFEQVTPTTFAPVIGGLTTAGLTPEEIALQEQREQAFRESIAIDPTMFGGRYQPSLYIPVEPMPTYTEEDTFDLAGTLAATEAVKELYPYVSEGLGEAEEAIKRGVIDPVEEFVQQEVLEPTEEFVQQKVLDPAEDAFKAVADPVEEAVQQYVLDPVEDVAKIVLDPVEEVIQQAVLDPIEDVAKIPLKAIGEYINQPSEEGSESVLSKISESLDEAIDTPEIVKSFEDDAKSFLDSLPETTTNLVGAYADVENMIDNPSSVNVDKAITAINDIGFDAKEFIVGSEVINKNFPKIVEKIDEGAPIVPPVVGETLAAIADIDSIVDAFENPDAESLTNAYSAANDLVTTYKETGPLEPSGLPAGDKIASIGTILTGLEDLEGGIETPAEAVNVISAANEIASLAGATTTSASGAPASGFLPAELGTFFAAASLVKPVMSALKGGAAGTYARIQGDFDLKDGRFAVGGGVRAADTYRGVGDKFAQETMNSGVSMANSLVDNYGFEIDEQALNAAPENIMKLQTSGYYLARNMKGASVGSEDFVVKLIQNGVLKPTENTPPEILTSNEAFASFVTDHLDKGRDEYAAKMYDITDGTGKEMVKHSGGGKGRKEIVTSRASFATQEAAQSWADDNFKETYGKKAVKIGRGYRDKPHRTTTSYSLVPVEVGDKTRYELKKTTSSERISDSEYAEATKPKPKPAPAASAVPDFGATDLDDYFKELFKDFDFSNLGDFTITL
jgi:hypothetical protein